MNKEQVAILRRVQKHILENPARLRMTNWVIRAPKGYEYRDNSQVNWGDPKIIVIPDCGTVGCIAGWTVLLNKPEALEDYTIPLFDNSACQISGFGTEDVAREILGINENQAEYLFYVDKWPSELKYAYKEAVDQQTRAMVVSQVINEFISLWAKEPEDVSA